MRYVYLGDRQTAPRWRGQECDPARDERGKCIVSVRMASALVRFADGSVLCVNRRRLRLVKAPLEMPESGSVPAVQRELLDPVRLPGNAVLSDSPHRLSLATLEVWTQPKDRKDHSEFVRHETSSAGGAGHSSAPGWGAYVGMAA